jgi:hypothetical protein
MRLSNSSPFLHPLTSFPSGRRIIRNLGYENAVIFHIPNFAIFFTLLMGLSACGASDRGNGTPIGFEPVIGTSIIGSPTPLATVSATPTQTMASSAIPEARIPPERWQEWPVVPTVRAEMKTIYLLGIESGNNPDAFTKIGDGEISTIWFLTQYDLGPSNYHLGPYADLFPVIDKFSGSFEHVSLAAGRGFNTTIILGPAPSGTPECQPGESRLDCELGSFHPAFAFVSLGTNQVWQSEIFQAELRRIIERLLEAKVMPILATKADNLEGDQRINRIIAELAYEYNLPMWNFWLAVQGLAEHGLQADQEHLSYAYSDFGDPANFQYAWPWRNLTALQVLDSVARSVTNQTQPVKTIP